METEYTTKDIKATSTKVVDQTPEKTSSPIFQKRQHWCFMKNGKVVKFDTKSEAEKALKE